MKTAIVTGASGFIGKALTIQLLSQGIRVYAVCRDGNALKDVFNKKELTIIELSFEEYSQLVEKIPESLDVWYHLAFQGGFSGEALKDYSIQLENANWVCKSVELAATMGIPRFVFASTINEIESLGYLLNGFNSPRNTCIYAAGKIAAEIMGKTIAYNKGIEFISALIAMPYGENNYARTLPNVVMGQISNGITPKLIEGNNLYDLVYIADIAEAFVRIAQQGLNMSSYYVGHRNLRTFRELITDIRDAINPTVTLNFGAYQDAPALDYGLIDLDALYRDTGFECKADFRESILKTAQWLKSTEETI